jgi:hypothetical protein
MIPHTYFILVIEDLSKETIAGCGTINGTPQETPEEQFQDKKRLVVKLLSFM